MASSVKNLNEHSEHGLLSIENKKIAVLVSEYHNDITEALFEGVKETLLEYKLPESALIKKYLPGAYELTLGAQYMAADESVDAVICLGCVIMGETKHFDFICEAVAKGLTDVSLKYSKPVIFGVLTPNNVEQAKDRAGGKHGNKGVEAAIAAIKMIHFMD
ncbi:6,7-dimethyl-8-ribityllumazine synthase [Chondrinema litorale]|uniref:6,7-dimethyl-8-ribityllumazine synthase n=1 Tax=Chondrinema litorale TaxID=2994555 RepID=UPI002544BC25|nr:6,7-dimethyl-8-ribityllumazine synthase [Chondrinema litorale]UZR94675.1 6,7-dimethyl-8-ribityllumazine synthase [Chondrinema litorale]